MRLPHIAFATLLALLLGTRGFAAVQPRPEDACLDLLERSERLLSIDDPDIQALGTEKLRQARETCQSSQVSPELRARALLAAAQLHSGDRSRQLEMKRGALALLRTEVPDSQLLPRALESVADTQMTLGDYDEALRLSQEALVERERLFGGESREYVQGLVWMSVAHKSAAHGGDSSQHLTSALAYSERAVELATRRFGPHDPATIAASVDLSDSLQRLGRFDDAESVQREIAPYVDLIGSDT